MHVTIFFKVASLAAQQAYDFASAREVILKDIVEIGRYQFTTTDFLL